MLQKELDIKNQQITQQSDLIAKQMELIGGLSERLREGNILMGSLQHQLKLPDAPAKVVVSTDAKPQARRDFAAVLQIQVSRRVRNFEHKRPRKQSLRVDHRRRIANSLPAQ